MRYRVYVGPRDSEAISPLQKDQYLFKEFTSLDEAFGWARHINGSGRITLLIDGDDGTNLSKNEIAAALHHPRRGRSRGLIAQVFGLERSGRSSR
jgi:hypothetical protein